MITSSPAFGGEEVVDFIEDPIEFAFAWIMVSANQNDPSHVKLFANTDGDFDLLSSIALITDEVAEMVEDVISAHDLIASVNEVGFHFLDVVERPIVTIYRIRLAEMGVGCDEGSAACCILNPWHRSFHPVIKSDQFDRSKIHEVLARRSHGFEPNQGDTRLIEVHFAEIMNLEITPAIG